MTSKYVALFDQKPNGLLCHLCERLSLSIKEIITHFEKDHSIEPSTLACLYIEAGVDMKAAEDETQYSDTEKHVCEFCLTQFPTYKGMKQHMGKMHLNKNKQIKCHLCPKKFKHKYALKFHINQVHECSTKVKCPNCSKLIYNKYSLKKHLITCK